MAFLEAISDRTVKQGVAPVEVVLSQAVRAGDPLGMSATNTWVLSADAVVEQPLLIAGEAGASGDKITAYMMAVLECDNLLANVGTIGEKVAITDAGLYSALGTGLPDVGFVAGAGSDSLTTIIFLCPVVAQLTVARS